MNPVVTSVVNRPREIADGIWWIPSCLNLTVAQQQVHVHNSPYLVLGSEKALLWDSSDPTSWQGISESLDELLDGRTLDYIVPSHQEVPHSGNVRRLLDKYPEAMILGDVRDYHVLFPDVADRLHSLPPGSQIDLGSGDSFVIVDAIIKDLPATQWGYATRQQVLFTADAFAYSHMAPADDEDRPLHRPDECMRLASELDGRPGPDNVVWITRAALYWARFIPIDDHLPAFKALLAQYPAKLIAPSHGSVIDDMTLIPVIWEALSLAYDPEGGVAAAVGTVASG